MEILVPVFLILFFYALLVPGKKPEPKSASDKLMEGIVAAAKEIKGGLEPKEKKQEPNDPSVWTVILITILLGFVMHFLL